MHGRPRTPDRPAPQVDHACAATTPGAGGQRLRWPLPALLVWALAWTSTVLLVRQGLAPGAALLAGALLAGALALKAGSRWRRLITATGFPVSALLSGWGGTLPAWLWLVPLGLLALAYPLRAWSDAPMFPTGRGALDALPSVVPLPAGASVLDAGCGLGHGLQALHRCWPQAVLHGIEWSRPLARLARWRCRGARITAGDMWSASWSAHDLVYLFQRPESMSRAWAKARGEMRPGSWLISLEFAVPDQAPSAVLDVPGQRRIWVYRVDGALKSRPRRSDMQNTVSDAQRVMPTDRN
ncbi:hypothetical protein C7444_105261 [Sphaerotilus hippei]|uniref:Methyltransferase family protein n=2 Tax=Sphaerotilus hippei TaxID=744406 RepID=A0A318HD11_9BURK|nr:hypothetical protein C7444_105261 [Sphaerotilus hippei]